MTDRPYNNPATREDKAEALRNERRLRQGDREPSTYHKLAGLADDLGGRFREKESIAGEQAATQYPKQNSASPWSGSGADPGVEPPTGVAIDAQDPVGEFFEIERSIAEQELALLGQGCDPNCAMEAEGAQSSASSPLSSQEKRASSSPRAPGGIVVLGPPGCDAPLSSAELAGEVDALPASNSRAGVERPRRPIPIDQPDDGLDVPRRADGMPLSSHSIKPRRKL